MLPINTRAIDFTLYDENNVAHSLKDYLGKKVILYFYPRDNTPGCTRQAVGFTELKDEFAKKNAVIIGISKDSTGSHLKFKEKQGLDLILLSDKDMEVIKAYDVLKEKKLYGKVGLGIVRTTYIIDEEGMIIGAYEKVKAAENPKDMLEALN